MLHNSQQLMSRLMPLSESKLLVAVNSRGIYVTFQATQYQSLEKFTHNAQQANWTIIFGQILTQLQYRYDISRFQTI
jgi:hypothetical protein